MKSHPYAKIRKLPFSRVMKLLRKRPVVMVDDHASVSEVLSMLLEGSGEQTIYVVRSSGELCGTISLKTLAVMHLGWSFDANSAERRPATGLKRKLASEIMDPVPVTIAEKDRVGDVLLKMTSTRTSEIPVIDSAGVLVRVLGTLEMLKVIRLALVNER
jgi:CBS domain-containing protein